MATSSRPFQSRTIASLRAGYRQMFHNAERWLHQGRTAVVWGIQVALYPLYAAVQGLRLGYRQLRAGQSWRQTWARLSGSSQPELVAADTPIRALLSVIQPPTVTAADSRPGGLRLVNIYGSWLKQSQAGAVLTPEQWHLVPIEAPVRGIASDLANRQLVLVTTDNGIFAGLTAHQQGRLHQAIALMMAEYGRGCRQYSLNQHLQQPWLPLPRANSTLLLPLRWLPQALRWMQTSPLAAATNVFGEASQQAAIQSLSRWHSSLPGKGEIPHADHQRPLESTSLPSDRALMAGQSQSFYADASIEQTVAWAAQDALAMSPRPSTAVGSWQDGGQPQAIASHAAPPSPARIDEVAHRPQIEPPGALEAQVTQVDYIDSPLVALLRGLDWLMYGVETRLRRVLAWLRRHW
ncbi:hypothetical protein IQ254_26090 [Nodosilinea sp. LEGE 07088]|uniref:hypothetical protein n=1 Tax=Nodosilinea sp. LEGE 07088 TaxID=2777968 RepID=UPI0018829BA5|nr:hypothetical protein [Nodosilinea sp. LEGE 07088]MBE9140630.1 hypothetical protein [Nodosilinea sp. LEGE 07088]